MLACYVGSRTTRTLYLGVVDEGYRAIATIDYACIVVSTRRTDRGVIDERLRPGIASPVSAEHTSHKEVTTHAIGVIRIRPTFCLSSELTHA
jgi:hypothetical protein